MRAGIAILVAACLYPCPTIVLAQSTNEIIRAQRSTAQPITNARAEWSKLLPAEITCIDNKLRERGGSVQALTQSAISPLNPSIADTVSQCRSSSSVTPDQAQAQTKTKYAVDGLAIGAPMNSDRTVHGEYRCSRSDKFEGFASCQRVRNDRGRRGSYRVINSVLSSREGEVSYVDHYQEPAFFEANEIDESIQQYSRRFGETPQITRMPSRPDHLLDGIIALWGQITLEQLDQEDIKRLEDGKSSKTPLLVDFIGSFVRSAKEGLPIYRIQGGTGFVWVSSFDQRGRGTLRFAAVDASKFSSGPEGQGPLTARAAPKPVWNSISETKNVGTEEANHAAAASGQGLTERKEANKTAKIATARDDGESEAKVDVNNTNRDNGPRPAAGLIDPPDQSETDKANAYSWKIVGTIVVLILFASFLATNRQHRMAGNSVGLALELRPAAIPTRKLIEKLRTKVALAKVISFPRGIGSKLSSFMATRSPNQDGSPQNTALYKALTGSIIGVAGVCILVAFAGYGILWMLLFLLALAILVQAARLIENRTLKRYKVSKPMEAENISSLAQSFDVAVPTHRWRLPVRRSLVFLVDENGKPVPTECTCYVFNDSIIAVFCHSAVFRIDYDLYRDVRSVTVLDLNQGKETIIARAMRRLNLSSVATRLSSWQSIAETPWLKGALSNFHRAEDKLRYSATVRALIVFRDFSSVEIECNGSQFSRLRCSLPEAVFSDERIRLVDEQFRRIERMADSGVRASPDLTEVIADVRAMRSRLDEVMEELSVREASLRAVRYLLDYFPSRLTLAGDSKAAVASEGTAST